MAALNPYSNIDASVVTETAKTYGTPIYLYDERLIIEKCKTVLSMPNAFGLDVRYAMKANPNKTILRIIDRQGLLIDASSLNEVRRAVLAGVSLNKILLTTQEAPEGGERRDLERMILQGLQYNVCSLRQLRLIGDFARQHKLSLSIRIHPGIGAGESASRNTGDDYCCFGIHLSDISRALSYARENDLIFSRVHVHIGSGGDPEMWRQNIDLELEIIEKYFPHADTVNFGGGLKEARMPDEKPADVLSLGDYAKRRVEDFYKRTGRKLKMEIEPGTYVMANAAYVITSVIDKKQTGDRGLNFIVVDGGLDVNARPLMYGARHPFYVVSKDGRLLSSEFDGSTLAPGPGSLAYDAVVAGRCCESGDCQCLDDQARSTPRKIAEPEPGDYVVIGGAGAYCSAMAPFNYNSHEQAPEVLFTQDGKLELIRKKQTLEQMIANEI